MRVVLAARGCRLTGVGLAVLMTVAGAACTGRPALTVTPREALQSGDVVRVAATGLRPGGDYEVVQCVGTTSCDQSATAVTADRRGAVNLAFTVNNTTFPGPPVTQMCRRGPSSPMADCRVVLRQRSTGPPVVVASVPISFRADPPRLTTKIRNVGNGEQIFVGVGELAVGSAYQVRWCRTLCDDAVMELTADTEGWIRTTVTARDRFRGTGPDGTVGDEVCYDRCQVRVVRDGQTVVARSVTFASTVLAVAGPLGLTADTTVNVIGVGFAPNEPYALSFCSLVGCRPLATPTTDGAGAFFLPVTVPAAVTRAMCSPQPGSAYACEFRAAPAAPGSPVSQEVSIPYV